MKTYQGFGASRRVTVNDGGRTRLLDPRYDLRDHSPDGFNWGYSGSGPAQLALALCCDAVGAARGQIIYQDFKFKIVAGWASGSDWTITSADVEREVAALEAQR